MSTILKVIYPQRRESSNCNYLAQLIKTYKAYSIFKAVQINMLKIKEGIKLQTSKPLMDMDMRTK